LTGTVTAIEAIDEPSVTVTVCEPDASGGLAPSWSWRVTLTVLPATTEVMYDVLEFAE
jgi:hypothetical protein